MSAVPGVVSVYENEHCNVTESIGQEFPPTAVSNEPPLLFVERVKVPVGLIALSLSLAEHEARSFCVAMEVGVHSMVTVTFWRVVVELPAIIKG